MKIVFRFLAILVLGLGLAACDNDAPASPQSGSVSALTLTANLLPANEVPVIAGDEAGGSSKATLTFNLTKDYDGAVTGASFDLDLTATGFPAGTTLTKAHIHAGSPGANGGIFVNAGLADGEVAFPSGTGSFSKKGITITVDQVNAILTNPSGFYFNIHTARNPDGVARGQLTPAQ